jgi:hypothetical protein
LETYNSHEERMTMASTRKPNGRGTVARIHEAAGKIRGGLEALFTQALGLNLSGDPNDASIAERYASEKQKLVAALTQFRDRAGSGSPEYRIPPKVLELTEQILGGRGTESTRKSKSYDRRGMRPAAHVVRAH